MYGESFEHVAVSLMLSGGLMVLLASSIAA
jgi:hypothetical protein